MIIVLDLLRVLLLAVGIVVAAYQVALVRRAPTRGQKARLCGAGLAVAGLVLDRLMHLGQPATWELVPTAAVVALFAYGSWQFDKEIPARPADPHPE